MQPGGSIAEHPVARTSVIARLAAAGALIAALVLVVLVLFGGSSPYTLKANFLDSGGLVTGDDVLIGAAKVGSVQSIGLTPDGQAQVAMGLDSGVGPLPEGTVARIYENSLSGIANKYVVLEPGSGQENIASGGVITSDRTYSTVNLDQLFDTLNPLTRAGLRGFIRGEAASIEGRAKEANQTLKYLAPALSSTSDVTSQLAHDEPTFDALVVKGAETLRQLGSRTQQLTALVANTNATTAAIASQSQALDQALVMLPPTLTHTTQTFAGLRATLDTLTPLVQKSIPASRQLEPFAVELHQLTLASIPTVSALNDLIRNPAGTGDLTSLLLDTPGLAQVAAKAFPRLIKAMNDSQAQVNYLREYAPDVVSALGDVGQVGGYYDANGHYARTQPIFGAFGLTSSNELKSQPNSDRYNGLQVVHGRCPGGSLQPTPDGSAPHAVAGCNPNTTPPGP